MTAPSAATDSDLDHLTVPSSSMSRAHSPDASRALDAVHAQDESLRGRVESIARLGSALAGLTDGHHQTRTRHDDDDDDERPYFLGRAPSYRVSVELPVASEGDSSEEVLSESDLRDGSESVAGTRPTAELAIHSDCRPIRVVCNSGVVGDVDDEDHGGITRSQLKSFNAFHDALVAQKVVTDDSADSVTSVDGSTSTHLSKVNRLASEHGLARKLKASKHHRRRASRIHRDDGTAYVRAHPLAAPLHEVDKATLAAMIDQRKGRVVEADGEAVISRALYVDVCRMVARTNTRLNEREADLQLAGQIGQAILTENGALEEMVAERSTQLAEAIEQAEEKDRALAESQAQVAHLTALNRELLESSSTTTVLQPFSIDTEPASATITTSSACSSACSSPRNARPPCFAALSTPTMHRRVDSQDSQYTTSGTSLDAELVHKLTEFLANELGQGGMTSVAGKGIFSVGSPSPSTVFFASPTLAPQSLNSPSQRIVEGDALSPLRGSFRSKSLSTYSQSSTSSASPFTDLATSGMLEDLASLQRKLRQERRRADLERANWASTVAQLEKRLATTQSALDAHADDAERIVDLTQQLAATHAANLDLQTARGEHELRLGVEHRLHLQHARREAAVLTDRLAAEVRESREENGVLVARRNDLARAEAALRAEATQLREDIALLGQRCEEAQAALAPVTQERDALAEELAASQRMQSEMTALLSALRDELDRQQAEASDRIDVLLTQASDLSANNTALRADLEEASQAQSNAARTAEEHQAQMATVEESFQQRESSTAARHAADLDEMNVMHAAELERLAAEHALALRRRGITGAELHRPKTVCAPSETSQMAIEVHAPAPPLRPAADGASSDSKSVETQTDAPDVQSTPPEPLLQIVIQVEMTEPPLPPPAADATSHCIATIGPFDRASSPMTKMIVSPACMETASRPHLDSIPNQSLHISTGSPSPTHACDTPLAFSCRSSVLSEDMKEALATAISPPSKRARSRASVPVAAPTLPPVFVLPEPSFPLSPSDQLQLAYLYRYLLATWRQAFEWLDSCTDSQPARWTEDRVSGHCFSCQRHWSVMLRRHHCRLCGALFCSVCSRYRADLDKFGLEDARCCLRCFGAVQSMTMSNSLSLWEQAGTLEPPAERAWSARKRVRDADCAPSPATMHNPNAWKYESSRTVVPPSSSSGDDEPSPSDNSSEGLSEEDEHERVFRFDVRGQVSAEVITARPT